MEKGVELAESDIMGNHKSKKKFPRTIPHRKKLSDITNIPILLKSRIYDENTQLPKGSPARLQDELASLKKMLAEKDCFLYLETTRDMLEENKRCMEKLWLNYCRKSKQNDAIILRNAQLNKDLMQAREKLKVLQHDNGQMSALYKAYKLEMKEKLDNALEDVHRLTQEVKAITYEKTSSDMHVHAPSLPECQVVGQDTTSISGWCSMRKRESKSYKEPSLKVKMKQQRDEDGKCPSRTFITPSSQSAGMVKGPYKVTGNTEPGYLATGTRSGNTEMVEAVAEEEEACASASHPNAGKEVASKDMTVSIPHTLHVSIREPSERPMRQAVSSIGSYREPPLNTKMRRDA